MNKNEKSMALLASFATLKGVVDEKNYSSPYQILAEFIRDIISTDVLRTFTADKIKNRLQENFGFNIPLVVVKSAIKKIDGLKLVRGEYSDVDTIVTTSPVFEAQKKDADESNLNIIDILSKFVREHRDNQIVQEDILLEGLIAYLSDDLGSKELPYNDLIAQFVVHNEKNIEFQDALTKIRQGSILYMGLCHNINETGSLAKPLHLYLSMELLFDFAGYNGKAWHQVAQDLFDLVQHANSKGTKKIFLYYFPEVRQEIERYFAWAKRIVEYKEGMGACQIAMVTITNQCKTVSDVAAKEGAFFFDLKNKYGISEAPDINYYDARLNAYNLEDASEKDEKRAVARRYISHINKLREGYNSSFNLDSGHIIVTNANTLLDVSRVEKDRIRIEKSGQCISDFAVSIYKITNLLWIKLGNGFGKKKYPSSASALFKAQAILSSTVARKAEMIYKEINEKLKNGEETPERIAAQLLAIREKLVLPENIHDDTVDEVMRFDSKHLLRFENALIDAKNESKEKDVIIELQGNMLNEKEVENGQLRDKLKVYENKEREKVQKLNRLKAWRRYLSEIFIRCLGVLVVFCLLFWIVDHLETKCKWLLTLKGVLGWFCSITSVLSSTLLSWRVDKKKYFQDQNKKSEGVIQKV